MNPTNREATASRRHPNSGVPFLPAGHRPSRSLPPHPVAHRSPPSERKAAPDGSPTGGRGRGRGRGRAQSNPAPEDHPLDMDIDYDPDNDILDDADQPAHAVANGNNRILRPVLIRPSPGGPEIPELLVSFDGHRAKMIWLGHQHSVLKAHMRVSQLEKWTLPPRNDRRSESVWSHYVRNTELGHLGEVMYPHIDMTVVTAFVERWQPETNMFHMPFGEMTITLHDVELILGVPIDGDAVRTNHCLTDYGEEADLLGQVFPRIPLTTIYEQMKKLSVYYNTLREGFMDESWRSTQPNNAAIMYLMVILSCTLFIDKTQNVAHVRNYHALTNLTNVKDHAWGTAALACLYRNLGHASREKCKQIAGCATLLQAWIYLYFPCFASQPSSIIRQGDPYCLRWTMSRPPSRKAEDLLHCREAIDELTADLVDWWPYGDDLDLRGRHRVSLYRGTIQCLGITEPYHPDRVARQFCRVQQIPAPPIRPSMAVRTQNNRKYKVAYPNCRAWDTRLDHCLSLDQLGPKAWVPKDSDPGVL